MLRTQVVAATAHLRSYAFTTTQTLRGGRASDVTTITGRAVRPASVAYAVVSSHGRSAVVTIGTHSWVRRGTGSWHAGRAPQRGDDPLSVLLAVLRGATPGGADATHLALTLPATAAHAAGFVNVVPDKPVALQLVLDDQHRVVSLTAVIAVHAKSRHLTLTAATTYSGFDAQSPVARPV